MVLEGAGWHQSPALRVPANLKLVLLPPYSPELNPVEHLWEHLRENYFGNRIFNSLDEVSDQPCVGLCEIATQPARVASITGFNWINTICVTLN